MIGPITVRIDCEQVIKEVFNSTPTKYVDGYARFASWDDLPTTDKVHLANFAKNILSKHNIKQIPQAHIHTPDDGRGLREVFVDGMKTLQVFYADTLEGVVDVYLEPHELCEESGECKSKRIYGKVKVVFEGAK